MKRLASQYLLAMVFVLVVGPLFVAQAQDIMRVRDTTTTPGGAPGVIIEITHGSPVQGFQTAVTYDTTMLTLIDMDTVGLDVEQLLAPDGVEFFLTNTDPAVAPNTGWGAVAAIFDTSTPFNGQVLPAGTDQSIVRYNFVVVNDTGLIGQATSIELTDGFGPAPGIENLITVNSTSVNPTKENGSMDFIDSPSFIRGDTNMDGIVNVADGIFLIQHLFGLGSQVICIDAGDVNDDGGMDISDMVRLIQWQFMDGVPPQAPYPLCGIDDTTDALTCGTPSC